MNEQRNKETKIDKWTYRSILGYVTLIESCCFNVPILIIICYKGDVLAQWKLDGTDKDVT